jgi:hypothetical protein
MARVEVVLLQRVPSTLTRALELYEDFDVFTMGHIHENASRNDVRDMIYHQF